jgi:hypothetical protein
VSAPLAGTRSDFPHSPEGVRAIEGNGRERRRLRSEAGSREHAHAQALRSRSAVVKVPGPKERRGLLRHLQSVHHERVVLGYDHEVLHFFEPCALDRHLAVVLSGDQPPAERVYQGIPGDDAELEVWRAEACGKTFGRGTELRAHRTEDRAKEPCAADRSTISLPWFGGPIIPTRPRFFG